GQRKGEREKGRKGDGGRSNLPLSLSPATSGFAAGNRPFSHSPPHAHRSGGDRQNAVDVTGSRRAGSSEWRHGRLSRRHLARGTGVPFGSRAPAAGGRQGARHSGHRRTAAPGNAGRGTPREAPAPLARQLRTPAERLR